LVSKTFTRRKAPSEAEDTLSRGLGSNFEAGFTSDIFVVLSARFLYGQGFENPVSL
jgi:hypothetical protein